MSIRVINYIIYIYTSFIILTNLFFNNENYLKIDKISKSLIIVSNLSFNNELKIYDTNKNIINSGS